MLFRSYGACAFMASVVVITGVNLVKSYEKMKRIDNSINSIVKEVSNLSGKETETVAQDDVVPVNVVYETKAAGSETTAAGNTASTTAAAQEMATGNDGVQAAASSGNDSTQAAASVEYKKYIVQKGDTILGISKKNYGTTEMASQIIELNELKDANKLYVGQEIKLP